MRRPLLYSCALHGVIALIALAMTPRPPAREAVGAAELAIDAAPPPIPAVDVDIVEHSGGGGPPHPTTPAVAQPARPHRSRPAVALTVAVDAPADEGQVEVAQPAAAPETPATPGDQAPGAGDGAGAGNGFGDGFGDGFGPGGDGAAKGRELQARVLGDEVVDVHPREGSPIISHDEATALRKRDSFPRLPESVWPGGRPYIVKLEICVAEDGRVHEAALRSSESARLDPVVLAAAKTWQYRPRLVDGKPAPFCHGVVIKYERW